MLTTGDLFVEVSSSSLRVDRIPKSRLYADAGVPEYWIVNLDERCVEVYRDPHSEAGYQSVSTHLAGTSISPQCRPDVSIAVSDLLPQRSAQEQP